MSNNEFGTSTPSIAYELNSTSAIVTNKTSRKTRIR